MEKEKKSTTASAAKKAKASTAAKADTKAKASAAKDVKTIDCTDNDFAESVNETNDEEANEELVHVAESDEMNRSAQKLRVSWRLLKLDLVSSDSITS